MSVLLSLAGLGCAQDDPAPPTPAPAVQVSIVDMSPSAQRHMLPAVTPAVASEPALRARGLIIPVAGVPAARLVGSFHELRGGRLHEAIDIGAPRGTPVLSSDDGTVLKLFTSRAGGLTVYVADRSRKFIYYYAHLDAYAPALAEGQAVAKGQQIGTVGTTGNAPPGTPHLHFAILRNDDMSKWWTGTPLDPFPVLRTAAP